MADILFPPPPEKPVDVTIVAAIISGIVSIIVAIITVFGSIYVAGHRITKIGEKADRLENQVGQISVPTGTIIAYGGPLDEVALKASGWLPCDGRPERIDDYTNLFEQIRTSWGGDGVHNFNLPDLRGVFLRGVNGDRKNTFPGATGLMDPEAETNRISLKDGGNSNNRVGSYQADMFAAHSHKSFDHTAYIGAVASSGGISGPLYKPQDGDDGPSTGQSGGTETRPKNAYVCTGDCRK